MNTIAQTGSGSPRALRAGILAAILVVIGCFGAAIAFAHDPVREDVPVMEEVEP